MQCSGRSHGPRAPRQTAPGPRKEQVGRWQQAPHPQEAPGARVQVVGRQHGHRGPQSHSSPSSITQLPQEGRRGAGGEVARQRSSPRARALASPALLHADQDEFLQVHIDVLFLQKNINALQSGFTLNNVVITVDQN